MSYSSDNSMKTFPELLHILGLSEYEAWVYSVLAMHSPASATYIAKACSLSRSSVYTTLSSLTSKGLVGTSYRNNIKQFIAQRDDALSDLLTREEARLTEKRAALQQLHHSPFWKPSDASVPQTTVFEGQEGLKKIYLSMMRNAPSGCTRHLLRDEFIWRPEWEFVFTPEWHAPIERWKKEKKMRTKLLLNPSKLEKSKSAFYRKQTASEHRFLPVAQTVRQFALYIIGDSTAILSIERGHLSGIHIVNRTIAQNYVALFEGLWAQATKK